MPAIRTLGDGSAARIPPDSQAKEFVDLLEKSNGVIHYYTLRDGDYLRSVCEIVFSDNSSVSFDQDGTVTYYVRK